MATKDIDRGRVHILKQMGEANHLRVNVGWMGTKKHKNRDGFPSTLTTPEIAAINHFGAPSRRIPPRPTLTVAADKKRSRYKRMLGQEALTRIVNGATAEQVLDSFGEIAVGDVVTEIDALVTPKNAASTIKRKGSSKPLIDTGLMRASVAKKVIRK